MISGDPYADTYRQSILDQLDPGTQDTSSGGGVNATQPVGSPTLDTGAPTRPALGTVARGDPNGNSTNVSNPANQYTAAPPPPPSPGTQAPPPSGGAAPPPATGTATLPAAGGTNALQGMPQQLQDLLTKLAGIQAPGTTINYQPQTTPAYDDAVRSAIMSALAEGQRPVDASDPVVAPILAAMNAQAQRSKDYNSQQLAERLSAQNLLHSGAYDVGQAGYNQQIDQATQGQTAQVMMGLLTDRRNRLMQALQVGANYLNADQARQLQAELSNVNSALQSYGVQQSAGLGLLSSLLQNQQFYDQLGLTAGVDQAMLNSNAVPTLPQGLTF